MRRNKNKLPLRVVESISDEMKKEIRRLQRDALEAGISLAFDSISLLSGIYALQVSVLIARGLVGVDATRIAVGGVVTLRGLLSAIDNISSQLSTIREFVSITGSVIYSHNWC